MEIELIIEIKISTISYKVPFLKYRLIFLRDSKVFDKPSGESNIERRVKISADISKEGT